MRDMAEDGGIIVSRWNPRQSLVVIM